MSDESEKLEADALNVSVPGKLVIAATGMFSGFALAGIIPVMPLIAAHFANVPGAEWMTRALVTVIGISVCLVAPFAASLAERFGSRRVLLAAVIAFGVGGCAVFFVDNLYAILANRIVVGIATGIGAVVALGLVVRYSTGNASNRWFGYIHTVSTVASLILIPLSGYVGRWGWNWPFLLYALIFPLVIMAFIGFPPDPPRAAVPEKIHVKRIWSLESSKQWLGSIPFGFIVIAIGTGVIFVTPGLYIPFHLRDIGIVDPFAISMLLAPGSLIAAGTAYAFGAIRKRVSLAAIFVFLFLMAAAGLSIIGAGEGYVQVFIGQIAHSIATGLFVPAVYGLAATLGTEAQRTRAMGWGKTGIYAGPLVGQILMEPVVGRVAAEGVLYLLGGISVLLAVRVIWAAAMQRPAAA